MGISIFDSFITVPNLEAYARSLTQTTGAKSVYCYYNNQFLGSLDAYYYINGGTAETFLNNHISKWSLPVEQWRRTFKLNKPKTIMKMGIEKYIREHKELVFHLTVKGMSVLYIMKFSFADNNNKTNVIELSCDENGQYSFL